MPAVGRRAAWETYRRSEWEKNERTAEGERPDEIECDRRGGVNLCSARPKETEGVNECAAEAEECRTVRPQAPKANGAEAGKCGGSAGRSDWQRCAAFEGRRLQADGSQTAGLISGRRSRPTRSHMVQRASEGCTSTRPLPSQHFVARRTPIAAAGRIRQGRHQWERGRDDSLFVFFVFCFLLFFVFLCFLFVVFGFLFVVFRNGFHTRGQLDVAR